MEKTTNMQNYKIVFDTNALLINPSLITNFSNKVVVPSVILNELDRLKKNSEHKKNASLAINNIEKDKVKIINASINQTEKNPDLKIIHQILAEYKELEVSINQTDGNGFTALIKASFRNHILLVDYLIEKNADPFIRDKKDLSALDYAIQNGFEEIAEKIRAYKEIYKEKQNG